MEKRRKFIKVFGRLLNYTNSRDYHGPLEIIISFADYNDFDSINLTCCDFNIAFYYSIKERIDIYRIFISACRLNRKHIFQLLIKEKGIEFFDLPFKMAIINGNLEIAKTILKTDKVKIKYENVYDSIKSGDIRIVRFVLKSNNLTNDNRYSFYRTDYVNTAINDKRFEIAKLLINDKRFEVRGRSLYSAIRAKNQELVKILLNHPDISPDQEGNKALMIAVGSKNRYSLTYPGNIEILKLLLNDGRVISNTISHPTILWNAVWGGNLEIVKLLLKYKSFDPSGGVAIKRAFNLGYLRILKLLFDDPRVDKEKFKNYYIFDTKV